MGLTAGVRSHRPSLCDLLFKISCLPRHSSPLEDEAGSKLLCELLFKFRVQDSACWVLFAEQGAAYDFLHTGFCGIAGKYLADHFLRFGLFVSQGYKRQHRVAQT
jgi:hypothetical protein